MIKELKTKYENCNVCFINTDRDGTPRIGNNVHVRSIEWDDDTHELSIDCILDKNLTFIDLMEIIRSGSYNSVILNVETIMQSEEDGIQKTTLKDVYGIREIRKENCKDCVPDHCYVHIVVWYDERISKRIP